MAYIYKITNNLNKKCYIGETLRPIEVRWKQHQQRSKDENNTEYLYNAIRKYGIENFTIEEIETCPDENRFERETYYILMLDTMAPNGYNLVLSQNGQTKDIKDKLLKLWSEGLLITEIAKEIKLNIKTTRYYLYNNGITKEQILERRDALAGRRSRKPVRQYDLEGNFIQDFLSASEAGRVLNLNHASISKACKGSLLTYKNFIWQYEEQDNVDEIIKLIRIKRKTGINEKKIVKLNDQKQVIEIFPSASAAGRSINKAHAGIGYAARNGTKAYGFYWEYVN